MIDHALIESFKNGICPKCQRPLVMPSGSPDADILVFGDSPGEEELEMQIPWVGPAGEVLKTEMVDAGLTPELCRATNIWLHEETPECEVGVHMDILMWMLGQQKPRAVLVMGAYPVQVFFKEKVSEVTGLPLESKMLWSAEIAMPMVNPAIALHSTVGEVRFAIENFVQLLKEKEII